MNPTIPNESELSNADIPPLMTVFEVARVLRISTRSVWRLVTSSKLVEPIRIGGSIRWRRADLHDWIARQLTLQYNDVHRDLRATAPPWQTMLRVGCVCGGSDSDHRSERVLQGTEGQPVAVQRRPSIARRSDRYPSTKDSRTGPAGA